MLPIVWKESTQRWCVYDADGKELWSTLKYSDAAAFAEEYAEQNKRKANSIKQGLK